MSRTTATAAVTAPLFPASGAVTMLTTANGYVQTTTEPLLRGRVMALYMAIFMGGTPVGAPIIGWIGEVWGPRWTIAIGTVAVGLALVGVSLWLSRHENVRVSYESQRRPRFRVTTVPVSEAFAEAAR